MRVEASVDDIDAAEALHILEAANKSERDLNGAVAKIRQRRADALLAVELPELATALEAIDAEIISMGEALNRAKQLYAEKCGEVLARQATLLGRHQAAFAAQQRLLESCQDVGILGQERLLDELGHSLEAKPGGTALVLNATTGQVVQVVPKGIVAQSVPLALERRPRRT